MIRLPLIHCSATKFGKPDVVTTSATCAAVEFTYDGDSAPEIVYAFAKRPGDLEYVQWGAPLRVRKIERTIYWIKHVFYRVLLRDFPPGQAVLVKISDSSTLMGDVSDASTKMVLKKSSVAPALPSNLQIHRTDPRLHWKKHDESVCVDLHWSHPNPLLHQQPDDVYFRIDWNWMGEPLEQFCADSVGELSRSCGIPLKSVRSDLPSSYAMICGLRPNRTIKFEVEAFNCDQNSSKSHFVAVTPMSAPNVVMDFVTKPPDQESIAGFRPMAVVDWIPQYNPLIEGHAVYLVLKDIYAMKLLCWVPVDQPGQLKIPIVKKNFTHSKDTQLLRDFFWDRPVHQEQELVVATRSAVLVNGTKTGYHVESPGSSLALGTWLVLSQAVKCFASFESANPRYVSHPVTPAWTQEGALTMYD